MKDIEDIAVFLERAAIAHAALWLAFDGKLSKFKSYLSYK